LTARVLLIGTYELGRQPFGLASPAASLRVQGHTVQCLDLSIQRLDEDAVRNADLVAFHVPMHTATRIAAPLAGRVRRLNPGARLCFYGLYAPMNEEHLRGLGAESILGGEFEPGLVRLASGLAAGGEPPRDEPAISLDKVTFVPPDRSDLPPLPKYAKLVMPDGSERVAGYTEASRGCKHLCRHCPVVPVYGGKFRAVPKEVVLEDVRRQVAAGAEHMTFGDPDFLCGPAHAIALVEALHAEHPDLTYDVTIKVEHLLQHAGLLPRLRDTGCVLVTSAVESIDDRVLEILDKGHTREGFRTAVRLCREAGIALNPTFLPFTPWMDIGGYQGLLATIAEMDLIENVAPIQLAIRLLIPAGSRLLELPEVRAIVGPFDSAALVHPWTHDDPNVDALQERIQEIVHESAEACESRRDVFAKIWDTVAGWPGADSTLAGTVPHGAVREAPRRARASVPYLTEPWYC